MEISGRRRLERDAGYVRCCRSLCFSPQLFGQGGAEIQKVNAHVAGDQEISTRPQLPVLITKICLHLEAMKVSWRSQYSGYLLGGCVDGLIGVGLFDVVFR
jgi:hypothetical protein